MRPGARRAKRLARDEGDAGTIQTQPGATRLDGILPRVGLERLGDANLVARAVEIRNGIAEAVEVTRLAHVCASLEPHGREQIEARLGNQADSLGQRLRVLIVGTRIPGDAA